MSKAKKKVAKKATKKGLKKKESLFKVKCTSSCATVTPEAFWKANTIYDVDETTKDALLQTSNFQLIKMD